MMPTRSGVLAPAPRAIDRNPPYKRIATEEPRNIPEVLEAQVRLLAAPNAPDDPSLRMAGMFSSLTHLQDQLMDIGERRIARMDELSIDKQLLLLTSSPRVQVLEPAPKRTALARLANDRLADACRRYPDRFAGLTVFAPQDVKGAVTEIERGMRTLSLNGAVLNSHFRGRYLDELEFWPILEALEAPRRRTLHPSHHPAEILVATVRIPPRFGAVRSRGSRTKYGCIRWGSSLSGCVRPFPQSSAGDRAYGRGHLPLLLYRFRLDAEQRGWKIGPARRCPAGQAATPDLLLFQEQYLDNDQRPRLGTVYQVLHGCARPGPRDLCDGLPLSAIR